MVKSTFILLAAHVGGSSNPRMSDINCLLMESSWTPCGPIHVEWAEGGLARLMDFPYLESCKLVDKFTHFFRSLDHKKINGRCNLIPLFFANL